MSEKDYTAGNRAAWSRMLGECLRHLGYDSPEANAHRWIVEREAAIATLRTICMEHGDNDWLDDLHLADIIEKHLVRHLTQ